MIMEKHKIKLLSITRQISRALIFITGFVIISYLILILYLYFYKPKFIRGYLIFPIRPQPDQRINILTSLLSSMVIPSILCMIISSSINVFISRKLKTLKFSLVKNDYNQYKPRKILDFEKLPMYDKEFAGIYYKT